MTGTPDRNGPPFGPGLFYETPASIACIYGFQPPVAGCNPYTTEADPVGGGKAIAIVDAYDNPNALADFQVFNAQFGVTPVTPASFVVVYAPRGGATPGSCKNDAPPKPPPAAGTGWDIEASLDVQWAHAMAPLATLYLIEAQSNSFADLFCAVSFAGTLLSTRYNGGEISMSWGGGEFPAETAADPVFTAPGVVYFASTGDAPGTQYPSVSPNVVAVGGTTLSRNPVTGNFIFENAWQDTGDGISRFESRPAYQSGIAALVDKRGVPDVAADANPSTGVWVFNSSFVGIPAWFVVGGTSVASPMWAGIANAAGSFSPSSAAELTKLYGDPPPDFNDITVGVCGPFGGYMAAAGWDLCTGLGGPNTYTGK
jgi:subtilase family serine protease